jgi:hypothetical protein
VEQQIVWSTAEVKDGALTVSLSIPPEESPQEWDSWAQAFDRVQSQLRRPGERQTVSLLRGAITVEQVDDNDQSVATTLDELVDRANRDDVTRAEETRRLQERANSQRSLTAERDAELTSRFRSRGP